MQNPIELILKDIALSGPAQAEILEKAAHLEHYYGGIIRCRVTVEGPTRHHKKGHYGVKVDLTVPGTELVVTKEDKDDVQTALRDAFEAITRRLEDHVQRRRGFTKTHEA